MKSSYEIFNGLDALGIRIFLHKVSAYPLHWHDMHEFLLVLEGQAKITCEEETYLFKEGDIIFINAVSHHMISAPENAVMLALQVQPRMFGEKMRFELNSAKYPNVDYHQIISIMANLIKLHEEGGANYELLMQSLLMRLRYEMVTNFYLSDSSFYDRPADKYFDKLQNVLRYVQENYRYDISLNEVAEKFFYSPSYLSRIFEKTLGINFKRYLGNLRLSCAVSLLRETNKSIDTIAQESGFPNTRSFVALYKETYGELPSKNRNPSPVASTSLVSADGYLEFAKTDYLSKLVPYIQTYDKNERSRVSRKEVERFTVDVDGSNPVQTLHHTFKTFCSVGRASDLLKQNIREMLMTMQKEIGFEYIKFHGIFDDDLSVYVVQPDGRKIISFDMIDGILDFLLSIHLKPLIQLSFMPKNLAKYPTKTTFFKPFVISEPADLQEWVRFVKVFVSHLLSRYGEETVKGWLFSLWNEPESDPRLFGFSDPSLFKRFYVETFKGVKEVCPSIRFGSSSLMSSTILESDYFEKTFLSDEEARPDFVNIHFYPLSYVLFDELNLSSATVSLSPNPYIMSETLDHIIEKLSAIGCADLPIYLTEWNSTTSHRDLINDTAFKGAYVARNIIDNYDKISSFCYWCLTDDILELPLEDRLFHGGVGLFTKNGIKKPPYYAFQFLSQLGNKLLQKGKGYIITQDARGFQMVLVNYIHYSDIYAAGELFDASTNNRYAPFRSNRQIEVSIQIDHAVTGDYIFEEYVVNRLYGSCYDIWNERYSGIEPSTPDALEALKDASHPKYSIKKARVEDGLLTYKAMLEPHEIRLVKIKRL